MTATIPLPHPGEILFEEFMQPLGISAYRLAKEIEVPITRITAIVKGKRGITVDTGARLARYFRMSERFFVNLQTNYDWRISQRNHASQWERIQPLHAALQPPQSL